MKLGQW